MRHVFLLIKGIFFGLIVLINAPVKYVGNLPKPSLNVKLTRIRQLVESNRLTYENVERYIKEKKLRYPEVVLKQSLYESSYLQSYRATHDNNILGLRKAKQRKTFAIGERADHAVFKTWKDCIKDYAILQKRFKGKNINDYYKWLERYAEDSTYVEKIKYVRLH